MNPRSPATALPARQWLERAERHRQRASRYTEPYLERRSAGRGHPVDDFLFTYYNHKPARLLRWHAGAGVVLLGPEAAPRAAWKYYRPVEWTQARVTGVTGITGVTEIAGVTVDTATFLMERAATVAFVREILSGTAARQAQYGCFGLHEWAMAYRSEANGVRHEYLPLRLGAAGTDQVVETSRIRCSHFDAFRFYTPEAVPLNELQPTRLTQRALEQPGCLHANMDLYKWAYKLSPVLPSDLTMDCFELAWRVREMDMRASPYDLTEWGYQPIAIETPEGKAEYVRLQRGFAEEAADLRVRLLAALDRLEEAAPLEIGLPLA